MCTGTGVSRPCTVRRVPRACHGPRRLILQLRLEPLSMSISCHTRISKIIRTISPQAMMRTTYISLAGTFRSNWEAMASFALGGILHSGVHRARPGPYIVFHLSSSILRSSSIRVRSHTVYLHTFTSTTLLLLPEVPNFEPWNNPSKYRREPLGRTYPCLPIASTMAGRRTIVTEHPQSHLSNPVLARTAAALATKGST